LVTLGYSGKREPAHSWSAMAKAGKAHGLGVLTVLLGQIPKAEKGAGEA
jgi:hypothetical protein